MAAQPPNPLFSIPITIDGRELHVTPKVVLDLARAGLTPRGAEVLALAAELLDRSLGDLIAAAQRAEGTTAPALDNAAAAAGALVSIHHWRLNGRMRV